MKILIINGPNLNLLGKRQPEIYGYETLDKIISDIKASNPDDVITDFQSNHEGHIIDKLHEVGFSYDGIILNAGAYTHTSIAIADACASITTPVIEVHISDIYSREKFRQYSYLKEVTIHQIIGRGIIGYSEAVAWLKANKG